MRTPMMSAMAAAFLLGGISAAHATVVVGPTVADASFENPVLSPGSYQYDPTASGAYFGAGPGGAGIQTNGSAFNFAPAPDGNQTAFIQTGGAIILDVDGLTPGKSYDITFYDANRPGYAINPIQVSYADISDPVLGVYTPTSSAFSLVKTGPFTANASSGYLEFASTTTGPIDTDIAIDAINISAVPEPSIWLLLIAGIGGIGIALRQAKRERGVHPRASLAA